MKTFGHAVAFIIALAMFAPSSAHAGWITFSHLRMTLYERQSGSWVEQATSGHTPSGGLVNGQNYHIEDTQGMHTGDFKWFSSGSDREFNIGWATPDTGNHRMVVDVKGSFSSSSPKPYLTWELDNAGISSVDPTLDMTIGNAHIFDRQSIDSSGLYKGWAQQYQGREFNLTFVIEGGMNGGQINMKFNRSETQPGSEYGEGFDAGAPVPGPGVVVALVGLCGVRTRRR